jgi:hypothetical protein
VIVGSLFVIHSLFFSQSDSLSDTREPLESGGCGRAHTPVDRYLIPRTG